MTDMEIKNAKPKSRPYFLSVLGGLRLLVGTNGLVLRLSNFDIPS